MSVTNWIATGIFKRLAKKPRLKFEEAIKAQEVVLRSLLKVAASTQFGVDHHFGDIRATADYQASVPLRTYDAFWQDYWQAEFPTLTNVTWPGTLGYFAKSSGTSTGTSKFIPCSKAMIRTNSRAGAQVLVEHFRSRPNTAVLQGRHFMFGGSPELEKLAPGVYCGELSGIAAKETPFWAGKDRYFPPPKLAQIKDWDEKLETLAVECLGQNIRSIGGVPAWLQILFERIFRESTASSTRLLDFFPKLEIVTHGGVSFEPYSAYFSKILRDSTVDLREIYAASEGFFAIADGQSGEGLRLIVDNGIFYEFVASDEYGTPTPTRHTLQTVEDGRDYVLVVSTCAGLWSYVVGDLIRFVDKANLRLVVSGRLSQTLSSFGEHVINMELEHAVSVAAEELGILLSNFAVASTTESDYRGAHVYFLEGDRNLSETECRQASAAIDRELIAQNGDYAAKRLNNVGIHPPKVVSLKLGSFKGWMGSMEKLGGQHKVPRVLSEALHENLLRFVDG